MLNLEEFIISKEAQERLGDNEVLSRHLEEGRPMQQLFGFSNDAMVEFYGAAKRILEDKRYEEAICAFVFLTGMNPYISDFWLGQGLAYQQNKRFDEAMNSYNVAIALNKKNITPYIFAAKCCMETKNFKDALEVLDSAEKYSKENPALEESAALKKEAAAAKKEVLRRQKKN